ncbi:MAG TPA: hypothetical protein ENL21_01650 [Caldithrix abyssi]|uniref:Uncharacterized protein n=1 Tax=Caldithrix abyssi TaxID=187145 RepID=A0A7V5H233_CALAY|nr:hypothetical protein [Caldithrix abyssi]
MEEKKSILEYAPILAFIASYFLFHLFDWMETTQFFWASIIGTITYGLMVADLKMEYKGKKWNYKQLNFFIGLLTVFNIVLFFQSFLHWRRMISSIARMSILYVLLIIFIAILFRAIRVYSYHKSMLENKKK